MDLLLSRKINGGSGSVLDNTLPLTYPEENKAHGIIEVLAENLLAVTGVKLPSNGITSLLVGMTQSGEFLGIPRERK